MNSEPSLCSASSFSSTCFVLNVDANCRYSVCLDTPVLGLYRGPLGPNTFAISPRNHSFEPRVAVACGGGAITFGLKSTVAHAGERGVDYILSVGTEDIEACMPETAPENSSIWPVS